MGVGERGLLEIKKSSFNETAETSRAIRLSNQHAKLKVHHIKSEAPIKQALMKYRQSSIYLLHMAQAKSTFNFITQNI